VKVFGNNPNSCICKQISKGLPEITVRFLNNKISPPQMKESHIDFVEIIARSDYNHRMRAITIVLF